MKLFSKAVVTVLSSLSIACGAEPNIQSESMVQAESTGQCSGSFDVYSNLNIDLGELIEEHRISTNNVRKSTLEGLIKETKKTLFSVEQTIDGNTFAADTAIEVFINLSRDLGEMEYVMDTTTSAIKAQVIKDSIDELTPVLLSARVKVESLKKEGSSIKAYVDVIHRLAKDIGEANYVLSQSESQIKIDAIQGTINMTQEALDSYIGELKDALLDRQVILDTMATLSNDIGELQSVLNHTNLDFKKEALRESIKNTEETLASVNGHAIKFCKE